MRNASKVRPSKREVIVIDDDSDSDQPVAKSVKREAEPVSSEELIDLKQKNLELQQTLDTKKEEYERLFRVAGEYQTRAETAENKLDSKDGIRDDFNAEKKRADELQSRLSEVSAQLDDAKLRLDAAAQLEEMRRNADSNVHVELALANATLKAEMENMKVEHLKEKEALKIGMDNMKEKHRESSHALEKRLDQVTTRLEDKSRKVSELAREKEMLKTEIDVMKKEHKESSDFSEMRVDEISKLLEEKKRKVSELARQNVDIKRNLQKRNEELERRLDQYDAAMQPLLQLHQPLPLAGFHLRGVAAAAAVASDAASSEDVVQLPTIGHPLADSDLSKKLLDLILQARNCKQLRGGIEVTKRAVDLGAAEIVILPADVAHPHIMSDMPARCEKKKVPYVFVKSFGELNKSSEARTVWAVCSIIGKEGSLIDAQIREIKKEVEKLSRD